MNYTEDKTFAIPAKSHALNGSFQKYTVTFTNVDVATSQPDLLRALEVLRTIGGQPIVTEVETKKITFVLEQPNVYAKEGNKQVASHDLIEEAKQTIVDLFANLKAVDGQTSFACTVEVEEAF